MASPPFDLTANPFHVLSVSLRSRKEEIAAAHDRALGDGTRPEAELGRALQALLVPRSRLEAELSWLPGLAPADADAVMRMLGARDFAACNGRLDHLLGLDAANLAAHLCGLEVGRPVHAERILVAHGNVDETRLAKMIDESRVLSGFPRLDRSMLGPALAALRKAHGEAALGWLKRQPDPGARMLALVEAGFNDEHRAPIMGELAGGYDRWTAPALQRIRDEIATEIVRMRADPEAAGAVPRIADALERWDAISQPMQVLEQAKGHDEPRSRDLYSELRTLCIWLSNERNVHAPALAISRALLKMLPELPSVALELERDIAALEELVDENERRSLPQMRAPVPEREASALPKFAFGAVLFVTWATLMIWANQSHDTAGTSGTVNIPSTSLLTAPPPAIPAIPPELAAERWTLTETPPRPGTDNLLTLPEVRYCVFQQRRLESLLPRIDASAEGRFNAAMNDWDVRCGRYGFLPEDRETVDAQVEGHRRDIEKSVDAMLASWTQKPLVLKPAAQAGAATPAKPAAPPVRYDPQTKSGAIAVQAELQARGFYEGKVDGRWGSASKAALIAWKTSAGLAPDAAWDAATERALMGE